MSLFYRFKKNNKQAMPVKSGTIEKEPSFIMLIPKDGRLPDDLSPLMEKLIALPFVNVISKKLTDNGGFELALEYKGAEYKFGAYIRDFKLPELFRIGHDFTDVEIRAMESARLGLESYMVFSDNNCESFHLQIKLLCAMIGEPAGIVDFSGERMLSGRWAKLAAQSEIPPSPEYLYIVQAVSGDENDVWLHTHGLNRCGGIELEILDSDKEYYNDQLCILNTLAGRIVSESGFADEYEPVYIMRISADTEIVAAWISWEKAIKMYPRKLLGGIEDRRESHNVNTGAVYLYKSEEDFRIKKLSPVSIYNGQLRENPILMITTEETERMRCLALERLDYMIKLFEDREKFENFGVLVKVGLEVDEEYKSGDMKEHIWFEIRKIVPQEETFSAELTQEPYYVKALKPGDIRECRFDEITDWIVFADGERITPDSVYKLIK